MGWLSDLKSWWCSSELRPLYEYRDLWAEEAGAADTGSAEWSFGNGATGFIGLPVAAGWELVELAFHADTFAALSTIEVALTDYTTPSNAAANVLATIALSSATDGGGTANNAYKIDDLSATPVAIPAGAILGWRTLSRTGSVSDVRAYARLRRKVGDYRT